MLNAFRGNVLANQRQRNPTGAGRQRRDFGSGSAATARQEDTLAAAFEREIERTPADTMPAVDPKDRPIKPEVRDHVNKLIEENQLVMFSKVWCPFCEKVSRSFTFYTKKI